MIGGRELFMFGMCGVLVCGFGIVIVGGRFNYIFLVDMIEFGVLFE